MAVEFLKKQFRETDSNSLDERKYIPTSLNLLIDDTKAIIFRAVLTSGARS